MDTNSKIITSDLKQKLKWLIIGRFLFGVLLLGSSLALQFPDGGDIPGSLIYLYLVILSLFFFSAVYTLIFRFYKYESHQWPAYLQIFVDTLFFSFIIYLTGGYISIFSFLYLLVIIIASILLYKKGSLITAAICCLEYACVLYMEKIGWIEPVALGQSMEPVVLHTMEQISFKIAITSIACFAVAILSGLLSEQTKESKKELLEMENHLKRVEKMAYTGQMASNLAHEIKNPLASLAGSIQLLREESAYDANQDRLMQIALRETDRLSALVSNFLLFARPPAGKHEEIRLDKAIEEILTLFEKDNMLNHRILINMELAPKTYAMMDPSHLHQILLNLLVNAAEAIENEGNIWVRMFPVKNQKVQIEISDNGCGISEENQEFVFDPFYTTKASGTGLGLSIVHSILETYDSRLNVESIKGSGTTVRFQLKRQQPV